MSKPLKYEAGIVYVDDGIQPHVARLYERADMDKHGVMFAQAPAMLEALRLWIAHDTSDDVSAVVRYADAIEATRAILARIDGETA